MSLKKTQVAEAVSRLLGCKKPEEAQIQPKGGCNGVAFSVAWSASEAGSVNMRDELFVKLPTGWGNPWEFQCQYAKDIGNAGIGPFVLGSDADALIQPMLPGRWLATWSEWDKQPQQDKVPTATCVGQFLALLHKVPVDPGTPAAPRYFYHWSAVPSWIEGDKRLKQDEKQALLDVCKFIDQKEVEQAKVKLEDQTFGAARVLTHGDLHMENILVQNDGSLHAVDLELAGPGPRVSDLAFFFWHWDWPGKNGGGGYPTLAVRQGIVTAYLMASSLDPSPSDVQQLLWEIEWEILRVAICRTTHCKGPNGVMVPLMRDFLVASESDSSVKAKIVEQGVMPMAKMQAIDKGYWGSGGSVHCFEGRCTEE